MARNAARSAALDAARLARRRELAAASPTTTFRMATINVLGDSHTRRGGDKPGFRSGAARMGGVVGILRSQNLDVVGLQEFERPQKAAFNRLAGGWDLFTGTERGRDSIAYRTGDLGVRAGRHAHHPVLPRQPGTPALGDPAPPRDRPRRLLHQHPQPHQQRAPRQQRPSPPGGDPARDRPGPHALVRGQPGPAAGRLQRARPGVLLGDRVAATSSPPTEAATAETVRRRARSGIDWIFGTSDIVFSDYLRHQNARVRHITDHPVVIARATITERLPAAD